MLWGRLKKEEGGAWRAYCCRRKNLNLHLGGGKPLWDLIRIMSQNDLYILKIRFLTVVLTVICKEARADKDYHPDVYF